MAMKSPPRGRAPPRSQQRSGTRSATRPASRKSANKGARTKRTGTSGSKRSATRTPPRASRSSRPARQTRPTGTKAPSRRRTLRTGAPTGRPRSSRLLRTGATAPRSSRHHWKGPGGMGRDSGRPAQHAQEPLEFVEVPLSGSAGSSFEPDAYTPKAEQVQAKPKRRGFLGLFGNR